AGSGPHAEIAVTVGLIVSAAVAFLCSILFCVPTLALALLTMPPILWLTRRLNLPRPAADMLGGAAAAYLCMQLAAEPVGSLKQYALFLEGTSQIFAVVGVATGALVGLIRHAVLNPAQPRAPIVWFA